MCKYTDRQKGFTILEILVVIVIIGILAAIALPKFAGVREDANVAVTKSNLKSIQTAVERYQLDTGTYPDGLAILIAEGYVKKKSCLIPNTTDVYQYGMSASDFIVYDPQNDFYTTAEGIDGNFASYAGGVTPAAQTI